MRIEPLLALCLVMVGCRTDPEHPKADSVLGTASGPTVGTVDETQISAAEVEAFARTHPEASVEDFIERERRAQRALRSGADVRFERKQAMVRALLEDEVEAKVPVTSVPAEDLEKLRRQVTNELSGFAGFEVYSVRVAARELLVPGTNVTPERKAELSALVSSTAERLFAQVPETNAIEAVSNLDTSWVDPALQVERLPSLKIADSTETRDLPRGWVRANLLGEEVAKVADGGRTPMRVINEIPVFVVRKSRIDPDPVPPQRIEELATGRAVAQKRKEVFESLLADLRKKTVVTMQPALLQEAE